MVTLLSSVRLASGVGKEVVVAYCIIPLHTPPDNVGRKDQDVPNNDADASIIPRSTSSDNTAAITKSLTASCRSKAVAATCRKNSVYLDILFR